mmetsp:Transcript_23772/g.33962  ORF Transcript_23772/g.33962 Transcript_23772/m.33962 type:complete len:444 (+) Transcript_23772:227-1558(+)
MFRRIRKLVLQTSEADVASPSASTTTGSSHKCYTCRKPITAATSHVLISPNTDDVRRYHTECFKCFKCNLPIEPESQTLCFNSARKQGGNNKQAQHPFHRSCYDQHFGWKCVVCEKRLPTVTMNDGSTKFEYLQHPFFDKERMCRHHARGLGTIRRRQEHEAQQFREEDENVGVTSTEETEIGEIRRCAGCHRFEPKFASSSKHFVDVGDSDTGRCVCLACCRTVVTSSDEAIPLWEQVLNFFEGPLGLITDEDSITGVSRQSLKSIPVMLVGLNALNDNMKKHSEGVHYKSSQIMTRGLCLSEFCGHTTESLGVTAILCLSGLPSDLTASILAHECMHAFIKLHPNFRYGKHLPLMVEEGLCQLVAFLFLNDGLEPCDTTAKDDSIPSDAKLRQYFMFCIETDKALYGQGFRMAARAYAEIGMQELLYYIALNRDFPPMDID